MDSVEIANRLTKRAEKGARLLDQVRPGWAGEINLDTLDMFSSDACVLGQLYGAWETGLKALKIPLESEYFGFNAGSLECEGAYEHLDDVWFGLIVERLS